MKKVLIIQTAFLGDVILATPLLSTLRANFPSVQIHFLVKKGNESLLVNHPDIAQLHVLDKSKGKYKQLFQLGKNFRKEKFDLVLNLHRFASSGLIAALSKGKTSVGFDKNPFSFFYHYKYPHEIGNGFHEVDRNLQLLQHLNLEKILRQPHLVPSIADQEMVSPYQDATYFCLAPASVWFTKQLPEAKWAELIQQLSGKGKVYLLGSPTDSELCERIIESAQSTAVNLAGKLSLLQSAALMKSAQRNYVNDSGPLHIASSQNAAVTAFFCSTTPDFGFGPLSDDSKIVETEKKLNCKPCGLHGHKVCPKGHFDCGLTIEIKA